MRKKKRGKNQTKHKQTKNIYTSKINLYLLLFVRLIFSSPVPFGIILDGNPFSVFASFILDIHS
jgi:hypothetical protein